jgi:excisionase family DNA binding protein
VPESPGNVEAESCYLLGGAATGSQLDDQEVSWEVPGADSAGSRPHRLEVPMSVQPAEVVPIAFSVAEVADLLGCSADTVRRMIAAGLLDAVQPLGKGGRVFVGRQAVEAFFDRAGRGQPSRM